MTIKSVPFVSLYNTAVSINAMSMGGNNQYIGATEEQRIISNNPYC